MKRLVIIGGVLAVLALGGFLLFKQYWYYLPGIVGSIQHPIGAHREVAWSEGPGEAPAGERLPNIIVIVADDLGFNDISLNGGFADGLVQTPNIDALAREGVSVEQGYASNATCSPSRAAIMTGALSHALWLRVHLRAAGIRALYFAFGAARVAPAGLPRGARARCAAARNAWSAAG